VEYPEYVRENRKNWGRNTWLSANFCLDRICYNFSSLSDVFVFNLKNKNNYMSGGASKLIDNRVKFYRGKLDDDRYKWIHWLDNPNFNPILYNPYQHVYYRIAFGEFIHSPVYDNSGHYYKKIVLSIFDESLEMIYETVLPNYKFNFNGYYSTSNGLLTFGNNPLNPTIDFEKLVLYYISVKNKNNSDVLSNK
jgi:hypothetical protein